MKVLRERMNDEDGLTTEPNHYTLADMCMFCRHARKNESFVDSSHEPHPLSAGLRRCFLFGCWVDNNGYCREYRMRGPHES